MTINSDSDIAPATPDAIAAFCSAHPAWSGDTAAISATFTFADFVQAMAFMQASIDGIETRQHHPEWHNVYNRVSISLRTHDAGNVVTAKDLDLAAFLSEKASAYA